MSIQYGWLVPYQVLLTVMEGEITGAVFQQWAWDVNPFYAQTPHDRLHIIIDGRQATRLPHLKVMTDIPVDAKRGWLIIIGMDQPLLRFMASLVVQMTRTELKFVDSLPEALDVLRRVDQSLPPDIPTTPSEFIPVLQERLL